MKGETTTPELVFLCFFVKLMADNAIFSISYGFSLLRYVWLWRSRREREITFQNLVWPLTSFSLI